MRYFILFIVTLFSINTFAGVYSYTDENGAVVFTDTPTNNATQLSIDTTPPPPPVAQPIAKPTTEVNTPVVAVSLNEPKAYTSFQIVSPKDQETIQNQPTITVIVNTTPPLQSGDIVQILLDGKPWGRAASQTSFSLPRPDRGTHIVSAMLIKKNRQIIKSSNANTVYIHQAHLGTPPPR